MTFTERTFTLPDGREIDVDFEDAGERPVIDVLAYSEDVATRFLKAFTWHAGLNPVYMHADDPAAVWSVLRDVVIDPEQSDDDGDMWDFANPRADADGIASPLRQDAPDCGLANCWDHGTERPPVTCPNRKEA